MQLCFSIDIRFIQMDLLHVSVVGDATLEEDFAVSLNAYIGDFQENIEPNLTTNGQLDFGLVRTLSLERTMFQ